MIKNPKTSKTDLLRLRIIEVKKQFKPGCNYTGLYQYEFGEQSENNLIKIRSVWNLRHTDEQITKNLEKIAKGLK